MKRIITLLLFMVMFLGTPVQGVPLSSYFKQYKKLIVENGLRLSQKELTELDKLIEFPNILPIHYLDLGYNRLTIVPEQIGNLGELRYLRLSDNQIGTLPDTIGQLTKLLEFNLQNNQILHLPETITHLNSLKAMNLASNNITTLPDTMGALQTLVSLNIAKNRLTKFPEIISSLKLLFLNLSSNNIATLPDSIGKLKTLRNFNLSSNKLTTLPVDIGNLKNLKELHLSNNPISGTTDSIKNRYFPHSPVVIHFKTPEVEQAEKELFIAIDKGKIATVRKYAHQITKAGWNIDNLRDELGNSPLHRALLARVKEPVRQRDPHYQGIKNLIVFGASKDTENNAGETPVHFATGYPDVLAIFLGISDFPTSGFPTSTPPSTPEVSNAH